MLDLLVSEYRGLAQDVLAFAVCFAALIWGRGPERAIAATWLIVFEVMERVYRASFGEGFQFTTIDMWLATSDCLAAVFWIAIAVNANRNYPLWIAGLQVLALTAHVARGLADVISPISYAVMVTIPGWMQLFILAIGLGRHIRREKLFGPYREWRVPVRFGGLLPAPKFPV